MRVAILQTENTLRELLENVKDIDQRGTLNDEEKIRRINTARAIQFYQQRLDELNGQYGELQKLWK